MDLNNDVVYSDDEPDVFVELDEDGWPKRTPYEEYLSNELFETKNKLKTAIKENDELKIELRKTEIEKEYHEKEMKSEMARNENLWATYRRLEIEQHQKKELMQEAITRGTVIGALLFGGIGILSTSFDLPEFVRIILQKYFDIVGGLSSGAVCPILLYYFIAKQRKSKKN